VKFGIYLGGECMNVYDSIFDAYHDAEYCTRESGIPHEVKIIREEN